MKMTFDKLNLIKPVQKALTELNYCTATEIQSRAIPKILLGNDLLGCAQTGTGKTAAFAIPIIQKLAKNGKHGRSVRALILTPTRELALQIDKNFREYAKYLSVKSLAIYGGVSQREQVAILTRGVEILTATPGRLLDLMHQGHINLAQVEVLVLDEADRMLDMGFINDVKRILVKVPAQRQTLFFTATMPESIMKFAHSILKNPVKISVTPESTTAETVKQYVYHVDREEKTGLLIHLIKDEHIRRSLVFTRTKYGADKLSKRLSKSGIYAAAIHGDKSQRARQKALSDFKKDKIRVLVATDIASRGIDIESLSCVINYELPQVPETYVHRIGRTGRAGKSGRAISFCDKEQRNDLKNIQKLIGFRLTVKEQVREEVY